MRKRLTKTTIRGLWAGLTLLTLLLAACEGGEPAATVAPPGATLPPVPIITATTPPTALPDPSPTPVSVTPAPDPLADPADFSDTTALIAWLRDAYSRGRDPVDVAAQLTAACWLPQPAALRYADFDPLWVVDLAGSGTPQWVLTIRIVQLARTPIDTDDVASIDDGEMKRVEKLRRSIVGFEVQLL